MQRVFLYLFQLLLNIVETAEIFDLCNDSLRIGTGTGFCGWGPGPCAGSKCNDFVENNWCTADGGYGSGWKFGSYWEQQYGTFEKYYDIDTFEGPLSCTGCGCNGVGSMCCNKFELEYSQSTTITCEMTATFANAKNGYDCTKNGDADLTMPLSIVFSDQLEKWYLHTGKTASEADQLNSGTDTTSFEGQQLNGGSKECPVYGTSTLWLWVFKSKCLQYDTSKPVLEHWSQWENCVETEGECYGSGTRTRKCFQGNCEGFTLDTEGCGGPAADGSFCGWTFWSNWNECHQNGCEAISTRTRNCLKGTCNGDSEESRSCLGPSENGSYCGWSFWTNRSECMQTTFDCGGIRTRRRYCMGGICPGDEEIEVDCQIDPCVTCAGRSNWEDDGDSNFSMCPIMPFIIENDSSPGTYNYDVALENEFHEQYDDLAEAMHNYLGYGDVIYPNPVNETCYCFRGCDRVSRDGNLPANYCCFDWKYVEHEHCSVTEPTTKCGEPFGNKFGSAEWINEPMEAKTDFPIISFTNVNCAYQCLETAGCFHFNEYQSDPSSPVTCELILPFGARSSFPPPADWVQTGVIVPYCVPYPFKDDFRKVTAVLCSFYAEGWASEDVGKRFLSVNDIDSNTPINQWIITNSGTESKSQVIEMDIKSSPATGTAGLILAKFTITTVTRKSGFRRKRSAGYYYFGSDSELLQKLQTQLTVPTGVEFIETVEIVEHVILSKDGVEVAQCKQSGQCECLNGATRNDNAECEIQHCTPETVDGSIEATLSATETLLSNDNSLERRRNRRARGVIRMIRGIQSRGRRRCAKNIVAIPLNFGGKSCDFQSFIDYETANDAMNTLCTSISHYQNHIHQSCGKLISRLERLKRRCEIFTDFSWM